ncbi:hypothetical protein BDR03DRAFT_972806 [Suillus americanus]|nr:hypothetical protein BDR03DRAFT_972806 [Suillus americanus]
MTAHAVQNNNIGDSILSFKHAYVSAATLNGHAELFTYFEGSNCGTPSSLTVVHPQRGGAGRPYRGNVSIRCRVTDNSVPCQYLNSDNTNATMALAVHVVRASLLRQQLRRASADVHNASGSILVDELASLPTTEQEILHSLAEGRDGMPWVAEVMWKLLTNVYGELNI